MAIVVAAAALRRRVGVGAGAGVVLAFAGGEAGEPAVAVEVTADADVVLEAALEAAQPPPRGARHHPRGDHAPDARAAVGQRTRGSSAAWRPTRQARVRDRMNPRKTPR